MGRLFHCRLPTLHSGAQAGAGRGFTAAPEKAGPVCHVCNRSGTDGNTSAKGIMLLCREAPLYSTAQPTGQQPPLKTSLPAEEGLDPLTQQRCFTINLGMEQGAAGSEVALSSAEGLGHLVSMARSLPGIQGGSNPAGAGQGCGGVECLRGVLELCWGEVLGTDGAVCVKGWAWRGAAHTGRNCLLGMRWGWEKMRWVGNISLVAAS